MAKLLMISGDRSLVQGKHGAFYNTLEEFHKYWERIDIIIPKARGPASPHPHGAQLLFARHGGPPVESPLAFFDNVFIHPSPWALIFQPFWIFKKGLKIYKEQGFNLMTVHEFPPFYNGLGAITLWNKIKVPYILEIFHIPGYPKAASLKEKIYRWFFYSFIDYDCQKAKAVRVMNSQVAEKLANLGIPESKINLIPAIYVDLDVFKPMDLEKKYDLIFIGRLEKNKGLELLLDAIKILVFKFNLHGLKVLIVGDGSERNKLEARSYVLEVEDNITFRGWARDSKEIARLMNESRILVMTSYNEGGPRVVLEAIACEVPILATSVGIVADIIKDGRFGQLIDWDSKDIAEKVKNLLTDKSEYQKYSIYSEAALDIRARFEKKSAIKNYAEELQKLI